MTITKKQIVHIAEHCMRDAYNYVINTTDVDRVTAMKAAQDSANEFARMMILTLSEHGVEVKEAA